MGQRRVTIVDLAEGLGLSVASVSYALNGKPGVSEATRERVLAEARARGWRPNHAAKALQAKRSNTVGLVMQRESPKVPMLSDFLIRFLGGLSGEFVDRPEALLFETVFGMQEELEVYRAWSAQGRIDALVIINIEGADDPRIALVSELRIPSVIVGDMRGLTSIPSVWTDDVDAMRITVEHLAERGHTRLARLGDGNDLRHLQQRSEAFRAMLREAGLPAGVDMEAGRDQGTSDRLFAELMARPDHPTGFQFDTATRAAEGLKSLKKLGYRVPEDCALIAWDNSVVCEITEPPLTTIDRDAHDYGAIVGRQVFELIDEGSCSDTQGTVSQLMQRGSS